MFPTPAPSDALTISAAFWLQVRADRKPQIIYLHNVLYLVMSPTCASSDAEEQFKLSNQYKMQIDVGKF